MLFHVTGARGLVGTAITEALAKLGDVCGTDVDDMDITDAKAVEAEFSARPPDSVIHLAGLKGNLPGREQPLKFFDVNTFGTLNLLEASRRHGVNHFVFGEVLALHHFFNEIFDHGSMSLSTDQSTGSRALPPLRWV